MLDGRFGTVFGLYVYRFVCFECLVRLLLLSLLLVRCLITRCFSLCFALYCFVRLDGWLEDTLLVWLFYWLFDLGLWMILVFLYFQILLLVWLDIVVRACGYFILWLCICLWLGLWFMFVGLFWCCCVCFVWGGRFVVW